MELIEMDGTYSIVRYPADEEIPLWILGQKGFCSITKTEEELSILCETKVIQGESINQESSWKCLKVKGPLDFSLTGVLSSIASPLAREGISIFAVSTFDTDYILVKDEKFAQAKDVLRRARFRVV